MLLCLAASMPMNAANPNLLSGATTSNESLMYSKQAFYDVWTVCNQSGGDVEFGLAPISTFSMVQEDGNVELDEEETFQIPYFDKSAFKAEEPVLMLNFPDEQYGKDYYNYNYQIDVPVTGNYVLAGVAQCVNSRSTTAPKTVVNDYSVMIFAFDTELEARTISIEFDSSDTPYSLVKNSAGVTLPSAFVVANTAKSTTAGAQQFIRTFALKEGPQYLTIYGPANIIALGDLMLVDASIATMVPPVTKTAEQSSAGIHDLFGRKVANPGKGIYIIDGKKVIL